jgi:hypothetical protein
MDASFAPCALDNAAGVTVTAAEATGLRELVCTTAAAGKGPLLPNGLSMALARDAAAAAGEAAPNE